MLSQFKLARVPLRADLFNGALVSGPVPILFDADQDADFKGLMEHAGDTLGDLHALNSRFFVMEHLTMAEALTYLQGPAKKAKGKRAFPPPGEDTTVKKKRKIAAVLSAPPPGTPTPPKARSLSSTGNTIFL